MFLLFVTVRTDPNSTALRMSSSFYFKGNCEDEELQLKIKNDFLKVIKNPMLFPPTFCLIHADCNIENMKIYCGATTSKRRKRGLKEVKRIILNEKVFLTLPGGKRMGKIPERLRINKQSSLSVLPFNACGITYIFYSF